MARAGKLGTKELLASPPIATAEIASEQCPLFGSYNSLGATEFLSELAQITLDLGDLIAQEARPINTISESVIVKVIDL